MLGMFKSLKKRLAKTQNQFVGKIAETIRMRGKVDEELMEELEEVLIQADVGVDLSMEVIEKLREYIRLHKEKDPAEVERVLIRIISEILIEEYENESVEHPMTGIKPYVILFVGVNGVGKTTTIGKLASRYRNEGKKVMLIAGDTFRAAAIEQLGIWADRAKVEIVRSEQGADPSSIVYDGLVAAKTRGIDVVLIDTAGRQHTKINLMSELGKIDRTIKKVIPDAPHESILVVDATTGQNAITQARQFNQATTLSGLTLTKLDGTAKGGIVLGIKHELDIPVRFIGVGEQIDDLRDFDAQEFSQALFGDKED